MALAHELPIYKQAYQLLDLSLDLTRNFPRDFKRLMGEKLRQCERQTGARCELFVAPVVGVRQ